MGAPIERFKDAYKNWRSNPFTGADMAVDKQEDNLFIPGGSPFLIQLLELPRKDEPTTVLVYCHDDLAWFTEVATAPAQGQFRVDYPPEDGKGTGLIEFNNLDNGKEVRIDYKATGSPALAEFLDTKLTHPPGSPADHQIIGFVSGVAELRYNPLCYFHSENVIYHASGEDESCLLFRFKKSAKQATVILELKGAKLHQAYYTELAAHVHAVGTYAVENESAHNHGFGTIATGNESAHNHAKGTLAADAVANHNHAKGTLAGTVVGDTANTSLAHTHSSGTLGGSQPEHRHPAENKADGTGTQFVDLDGDDVVTISGNTGAWSIANLHKHAIDLSVPITGDVANSGGHGHDISGTTAAGSAHNHSISGTTAAGSAHNHSLSGSSASTGTTPKTYPDQLKVYINGVDKTAEILALTALAQFGDGLDTHAFVTTGSGEMDISALIVAAQIHEIKITEPIAAKGGRCLLHLEVY